MLIGVSPIAVAIAIYRQIRQLEGEHTDEEGSPPSDSPVCAECGAPVFDYDDICAECGALTVASNVEDAPES